MFNWFKNKKSIETVIAPVAPAKPSLRVNNMALAHSANARGAVTVFDAAIPHPSIKVGKTIAMDDSISESNLWANTYGAGMEGVTFLGYPVLAELAQRPEYRMICETIASEMTREFIEFTARGDDDDDKSDKIKELEDEFNRLNVSQIIREATEQDGYFGRGHIYIDTGDTDNTDELVKSIGDGWDKLSEAKLKKTPIKALRTVEAVWCYPTSYNSNDPLTDDWYRPNQWQVQSKAVHSSRLLTIVGREVPDLLKPTYSFGGLSLSQMAKPYVENWLQTRQAVNDIISAFSVFVLATNLGEQLQGDGGGLFTRAELFNNLRDNRGLMIIDKEQEAFQNVSASLGGLSDLQGQAQEHLASVSHIPTVKLLGIQPAGLNASSEDQMRVFYDYIHAYQEKIHRAPLRRLMGYVMLSLWGKVDPDIDFKFRPLYSLDEKAEAEVSLIKAQTDQVLIDNGVISPEEARQRVASDPDSGYNSLDVDDVPDLLQEEMEGLNPKGGASEAKSALDKMFGK